jgi:phospholipid N-methyltransferase
MKLEDYYREVVDMNDSLKGGWGSIYYGIFSKVIEENNYKNIAEIGIGYGTHAKYILKNNTNINHLYLIDPMKYYPNDNFVSDILKNESNDHFNEMFQLINKELLQYKDKYTWFRVDNRILLKQ